MVNRKQAVRSRIWNEKFFDLFIYVVLTVILLIYIFPIMYVVSASFTPYSELIRSGGFIIFPKQVTWEGYYKLITDSSIPQGFKTTVFITVVGTAINMALTTLTAYPLSKRTLPGRSVLLLLVVITMFFSGGLIPTYLNVKSMKLINSVWALILPTAISAYNVILMKNYFAALPDELFEAATIDGCSDFATLFKIALPLSKPVTMTVFLLYVVANWNIYLPGVYYIYNDRLKPLQLVLKNLLDSSQRLDNPEAAIPTLTLQMAAIVVTSIPVIAIYPFIQKHFTKGILLGAVKG